MKLKLNTTDIVEQELISDVRTSIMRFTQQLIGEDDFIDLKVLEYFADLEEISAPTLQVAKVLGSMFDILNCLEELIDSCEFVNKKINEQSSEFDRSELNTTTNRILFLINRIRSRVESKRIPRNLATVVIELTYSGSSFLHGFEYIQRRKNDIFKPHYPRIFLQQMNIATEHIIELLWRDFKSSLDDLKHPTISHKRLRDAFIALVKYYNSCRYFFDNVILPFKTSYMHNFVLCAHHVVLRVATDNAVSCDSCQHFISKRKEEQCVALLQCANFRMPLCTHGIVISCDLFSPKTSA